MCEQLKKQRKSGHGRIALREVHNWKEKQFKSQDK